jgi:hypothetical protein
MTGFNGEWAAATMLAGTAWALGGPVASAEVALLVGLAVLGIAVVVVYVVSGRSGRDEPPRRSADRSMLLVRDERGGPAVEPKPVLTRADSAPTLGSLLAVHQPAQPVPPSASPPPLERRRPAPPSEAFTSLRPVSGPRHRADDRPPVATLSNKSTIGGRVVGPDGRPVVGAVLNVTDSYGDSTGGGRSAVDGQYRLHLPTGGTYLLHCSAEGLQSAALMVTVAASTLTRDIVLGDAGGIDGWIRHQHGAPAAGATVSLTDLRGEVVAAAVAGSDGGYRLHGLNAGEYTLVVNALGAQPTARVIQVPDHGTGQVDIALRSNGALRGTVRSAKDARQVPDASVTLVNVNGDLVAASITGADGEYVFAEVPPGGYTLIAAGYAPVATPIHLTGERTEVCDVVLGSDASVEAGSVAR